MKKNKTAGYSTVSKRLGGWMLAMGVPCTNSKSIMKMKRGGQESCKNIEEILNSKLSTILEDPAEEYDDMMMCSYFYNDDNHHHRHYCGREEQQIRDNDKKLVAAARKEVNVGGDWQVINGWKKVKDLQQSLKKTSCRLLMNTQSSSSAGFRFSLKRSYVYFLAAKGTLPSGGRLT